MSVGLYDEALVSNLRSLFKKNVFINSPEDLFFTIARLEKDEVKLPLINIRRTGISLVERKNHSQRFEGRKALNKNGKVYNVQLIPIRINYLFDIYSKGRSENDDILRELIFYYSTHPTLKVKIPYDLDIVHKFNIFFDDDIEDNSDIEAQKEHGVYFRQTLSVFTDDSYLWQSSSRYPINLDIDLTTEESEEVVIQ